MKRGYALLLWFFFQVLSALHQSAFHPLLYIGVCDVPVTNGHNYAQLTFTECLLLKWDIPYLTWLLSIEL